MVGERWVPVSDYVVRRAAPADGQPPTEIAATPATAPAAQAQPVWATAPGRQGETSPSARRLVGGLRRARQR